MQLSKKSRTFAVQERERKVLNLMLNYRVIMNKNLFFDLVINLQFGGYFEDGNVVFHNFEIETNVANEFGFRFGSEENKLKGRYVAVYFNNLPEYEDFKSYMYACSMPYVDILTDVLFDTKGEAIIVLFAI